VFVKGGFVGLPVGLAAALLRIPIVTHDSDSIPGLTNRLLSRFAKLHAVGLSERLYSKYYPKEKIRFTGVPIERKYWNVQDNGAIKKEFKINKNNTVVTVIGGSLGAVRMNNAIIKIVHDLTNKNNIHIVWVTGRGQHREIDNKISITDKKINNLSIFSFSSELHKLIAIADLVVSRAGASSIAELAALSKPTIIVPNPNLAGGHQLINAYALKDESAAVVLEEERLMDNPYTLYDLIIKILDDNKLSQKLSVNIHKLSKKDASNAIAKVIIEATN
jgi:UDP-N-acetylglucosamine--N-acetylmuramyl-(pentapeptide) pyrophosphoryl-undecaprenol N-acetylglucosamine transferase